MHHSSKKVAKFLFLFLTIKLKASVVSFEYCKSNKMLTGHKFNRIILIEFFFIKNLKTDR